MKHAKKVPQETNFNFFPVCRIFTIMSFAVFLYFIAAMSVGPIKMDLFDKTDTSLNDYSMSEKSIPRYSYNTLTAYIPDDMNRIITTAWSRQETNKEKLIDILNKKERRPQQRVFYNTAQRSNSTVTVRSIDRADS